MGTGSAFQQAQRLQIDTGLWGLHDVPSLGGDKWGWGLHVPSLGGDNWVGDYSGTPLERPPSENEILAFIEEWL